MKTLILASIGSFITDNNIDAYLPKKIIDCKIAYVRTAEKEARNEEFIAFLAQHRKKMQDSHFNIAEFDIDGKNENDLRELLVGFDIIMVEGGSTFYLLKTVRESGFENVVKDLIDKGVVYIGFSAGAYIACPSIIISTYSKHQRDRFGLTDFTAMNLVPFLIKAHYTPDMLADLKEIRKELKYPLHLINDKQALLIRDDKVELLGGGEKIIL